MLSALGNTFKNPYKGKQIKDNAPCAHFVSQKLMASNYLEAETK